MRLLLTVGDHQLRLAAALKLKRHRATSPITAPGRNGADDDKVPRPGIPNVTPLIVQRSNAGAYDNNLDRRQQVCARDALCD